jgi:hypothetical protein
MEPDEWGLTNEIEEGVGYAHRYTIFRYHRVAVRPVPSPAAIVWIYAFAGPGWSLCAPKPSDLMQ